MRKVGHQHWGSLLWELFSVKGRDRLLNLHDDVAEFYDHMKDTLMEGFRLTTEEYRVKFRDTQKGHNQTWVEFVDSSVEA